MVIKMYLKLKNNRIKILEYTTKKDRFKSLKFVLEPIDYGIKIPHKKIASTYFFCQRVDVCLTDKEDKIIALYENIKSEKRKLKWKTNNVYFLPLNTSKYLKIGEKMPLIEK